MQETDKHLVLLSPGLGDSGEPLLWTTRNWESNHGLTPRIYIANWKDESSTQEDKLQDLLDTIKGYSEEYDLISLIGTSASGHLVLRALAKRPDLIEYAVSVCGRARTGDGIFLSFDDATSESPAFRQSVLEFERQGMPEELLPRVMTVRPIWDEIVPVNTVPITGATNIKIPTAEHILSISLAMTLFSSRITDFLKRDT